MHREALSEVRVLGQPVKAFYEHAATPWTGDPPALELNIDTAAASREVARAAGALVVPAAAPVATLRAARSFFRRRNRGLGSNGTENRLKQWCGSYSSLAATPLRKGRN